MAAKPTLAVFKFASCDGCQLSLLDAEDELLAIADAVDIAYFLEARTQQSRQVHTTSGWWKASITTRTTPSEFSEIRKQCRFLVTIGACATAGGIQALRNWARRGRLHHARLCPSGVHQDACDQHADRRPRVCRLRAAGLPDQQVPAGGAGRPRWCTAVGRGAAYSVCVECKRRGTVCVAVARGIACLGPVTQAGCGAICPSYRRECFGCYGPKEQSNSVSLSLYYVATNRRPTTSCDCCGTSTATRPISATPATN